ncbi:hypothetical protein BK742_03235 [Bacillus thuringiensis serovar pingluonsis]|uniref:Uncharacterized protein n=1 Tax=Bacillus thuringiensis serovar pingluonsis TaxID=180881 RepID=A0A243BP26_BACTU|nr:MULTISPECIES: hypothetical protein [Bacillus cereus group]MEB9685830.1 hypothetical protein [Bacillus anthracis]OTY48954.1 hypothetical protein BK742_03235 [Bacillus thuringiensis serovar pingluonsis]
MNLVIEKSQGKLQNDAHLHDIIEEIKELANPLWISSVSMLQAHNQNFNTKATTFKDITISDLRDLKVSLSLIYEATNISRMSIGDLNKRLSIQSGKDITSYEDWLLHENRGIICEMIDEFRKKEWIHPDSK